MLVVQRNSGSPANVDTASPADANARGTFGALRIARAGAMDARVTRQYSDGAPVRRSTHVLAVRPQPLPRVPHLMSLELAVAAEKLGPPFRDPESIRPEGTRE